VITNWFCKTPMEPTVEFVSLTEKWSPGHFCDDFSYKLVIRIDGEKKVVKSTVLPERLTYKMYNIMLAKALPRPISELVKAGYKVVLRESFINSKVRERILSELTKQKPPKVR
jgi:hypothetical protein